MIARRLKLLAVATGAAVLIVTPCLAGPYDRTAATSSGLYASDQGAYDANPVARWDGKIVGADPDVNVRFQLMRDGFADEN